MIDLPVVDDNDILVGKETISRQAANQVISCFIRVCMENDIELFDKITKTRIDEKERVNVTVQTLAKLEANKVKSF